MIKHKEYRRVSRALEILWHDSGLPFCTDFSEQRRKLFVAAEDELRKASLSEAEFEDLVIGEKQDQNDLKDKYNLTHVDELIVLAFNEDL